MSPGAHGQAASSESPGPRAKEGGSRGSQCADGSTDAHPSPGPRAHEGGHRGSQCADGSADARPNRRSLLHFGVLEDDEAEARLSAEEKANRFAWKLEAEKPTQGVRFMYDREAAGPDFNERSGCQKRVGDFLSWTSFDLGLGVLICLNGITLGVETVYSRQESPLPIWLETWNTVVFCVYFCELCLRFYAFGCGVLRSSWFRFDTFLVCADIFDLVIKLWSIESAAMDKVIPVDTLKMLRLIRLARAVRLMVQFKVLWQFVQGVVNSCLTLVWTFVFLFMFMYLFALCGMELIRRDPSMPPEYDLAASKFDDGLGGTLLLLIQLLTLDSVGSVYRPLILNNPILAIYFVGFILVVSIALMNLVTAIMVETSMRTAEEDMECRMAWQEAQRRKAVPKLRALFEELDVDGSGMLDREELVSASELLKNQLSAVSKLVNLEELFICLDYDHTGEVDIEEFCEGLLNMRVDKPLELFRLLRLNSTILNTLRAVHQELTGEAPVPQSPRPGAEGGYSGQGRAAGPAEGFEEPQQPPRPTMTLMMERMGALEAHLGGMSATIQTMSDSLRSVEDAVRDRPPRTAKVTEVEAQIVGRVVGKAVVSQGTSGEEEAREIVDQAVVKQVTADLAQQLSAEVTKRLSTRREKEIRKQADIEPILVNLESFLRELRSLMRPDATQDCLHSSHAGLPKPQADSPGPPPPWGGAEPGGSWRVREVPPRATEPMLSPSKLQVTPTRPCRICSEEDAEIPPPPFLMLPEAPPNPAALRAAAAEAAAQHGRHQEQALLVPQPESTQQEAADRAIKDQPAEGWRPGKWWPLEDDPGGSSPTNSGSVVNLAELDKAAL